MASHWYVRHHDAHLAVIIGNHRTLSGFRLCSRLVPGRANFWMHAFGKDTVHWKMLVSNWTSCSCIWKVRIDVIGVFINLVL
jgi:hypothetical protein